MHTNLVLEKARRGEATLGCFVGLGSPTVVELLGHAGVDWLVPETEHAAPPRQRPLSVRHAIHRKEHARSDRCAPRTMARITCF